jgi:predicted deacylase
MPVLIYEAGEALRFNEISIRAGMRGILNVMRHIGMLPKLRKTKEVVPVVARSTSWVRAPDSGIVNAKVELGNSVRKDQSLALISDPLGVDECHVLAPFDGIVIGKSNLPLTHEGDALFHIAAFKSVPRAENLLENFTAQHDDNAEPT